ncbi:hypothetical protein LTR86_003689 [Recurvomyces mirabilis]|nr:hypothetical protein LTR86_003689 [Recurvomyces mirabilis]
MALLTLLPTCVAGAASHILYFHRFECHMHATKYLNVLLLVFVASVLVLTKAYNISLAPAIATTTSPLLSYLTGLYTSLMVYRLFLNPLNRYPGPYAARISSLWWSFQLGKSDGYLKLKNLHDNYGPIVRIGSSDLSIIDPDFMEPTFGLHAVSSKSYWDYETTIDRYNETLVQRIADFHGGPVNVRKWFNLWSFDVMGQLAFGKDYGMLESGEKHAALALLSEGMQPLALMLPTWMFRILTQISFLGAGFQKFVKFCIQELSWRVENANVVAKGKDGRLDIMGWILKAYQGVDKPQRETLLQADTRLIIVAGL